MVSALQTFLATCAVLFGFELGGAKQALGQRRASGRAGRFKLALRTQRWRARQAALAKIVTHQGSQDGPVDDVLPATQTSALAANMAANGLMQLLSTPSPQDRWGDRTGITLRPCRR